jgi:hypothetical protein
MQFRALGNRLHLPIAAHSNAQSGAKSLPEIRRRSGLELAGGLLLISLVAIVGTVLHSGLTGNAGDTKAAVTAPSPTNASAATTSTGNNSLSHANADGSTSTPSSSGDKPGSTTTNISVTTTTTSNDGATSTNSSVSVDGHPVTPPTNGTTTHTYTGPDGQQTTVTTSNNQSGGNSSGTHFNSNNLYLNSYSSSNNFREVY